MMGYDRNAHRDIGVLKEKCDKLESLVLGMIEVLRDNVAGTYQYDIAELLKQHTDVRETET